MLRASQGRPNPFRCMGEEVEMDIFEAISLYSERDVKECIRAGVNLDAPNSQGVVPIVAALDAAVSSRGASLPILHLLRGAGADMRHSCSRLSGSFNRCQRLCSMNSTVRRRPSMASCIGSRERKVSSLIISG